ncbi:MAG: hypothetical protein M1831_000571 [Alyxoria varia]|nr:MAG: hypothetical protein M1831_000571 [Alyxoria varia]
MPSTDFDLEKLTEQQQLALQQFTSVTDQELTAAVPLLQKCEWNVQIAIARFFDGEPPEPEPSVPPPQPSRRQETLLSSFDERPRSIRHGLEPAPRVVGLPENQINQRPPLILSIILTPVNAIVGIFSKLYNIFSYLFPFLPRLIQRISSRRQAASSGVFSRHRRPRLGPQATATRFITEFQETFGEHEIPMLNTSYSRAFDKAKSELRYLLVIPFSFEHPETENFIRSTLCSRVVTAYLSNPSNMIDVWAGSVADSEAYQVATAYRVTTFPFAALVALTPQISSTTMSTVARISGPISPENFIATLDAAKIQNSEELERLRSRKAEQDATRALRDEQDSAYERSLAADRERTRKRKEADSEKARIEAEEEERTAREKRYAWNLAQWKRWRAKALSPEPGPDVKEAVRVNIRLLDGEKVMRKFAPGAELEEIYAFVECHDVIKEGQQRHSEGTELDEKTPFPPDDKPEDFEHVYGFRLVTPMPREVFNLDKGGTVKSRIGRSGNLIAERIEEEEEEDDDDTAKD